MISETSIRLIAGHGGNGAISFRREKFVPRGGPDGGDGGNGADIVIQAETALRGLEALRRTKVLRAEAGGNGGPRGRRGKSGVTMTVMVPVGTVVWEKGGGEQKVADLRVVGMQVLIAKGGEGGGGNRRFATSVRKAPRIAEKGMAGEDREVRLELRLMAEVGLVGLPNAGKSSLLQAVSHARPRVAAYPFTTLEPYLGFVEVGYDAFVVADIPGLIEGAHLGQGLGIEFLQHVQRTRVLVHVVDGARANPSGDIDVVRQELRQFGQGLAEKRWVVALNKQDLPEARERASSQRNALEEQGAEVFEISALTGQGIGSLIERLLQILGEDRGQGEAEPVPVLVPQVATRRALEVRRTEDGFEVRGYTAERIVEKLGLESPEAEVEVVRRLRRAGVAKALRRAGAKPGDKIRLREEEFEWPG